MVRKASLKGDFVEFAEFELNLSFVTLIQKFVYLVSSAVIVSIADSKITKDSLETSLDSDLRVAEDGEESIVDHPSENGLAVVPRLLIVQDIALVVGD